MERQHLYAYERVADDIERRISTGELGPGSRLPNRHDLATTYEVSTRTIQTATKLLVKRGLVDSTRTGLWVRGTPEPAPEPQGDEIDPEA